MKSIRVRNRFLLLRYRISTFTRALKQDRSDLFRAAESIAYGRLGGGTSASDNGVYPELCKNARSDDKIFRTFRSVPSYRLIVGGVSAELGNLYIDAIHRIIDNDEKRKSYYQWIISTASKNDIVGNPYTFNYQLNNQKIRLSPDTLYYCKVLADLLYMFDMGSINNITEIGVGYGGLLRLIDSYCSIEKINLVDLGEVLGLAERYLSLFKKNAYFDFLNGAEIKETVNTDLLISNYAFTELKRDIQDGYFDTIVSHAKSGYMICNRIAEDEEELGGYTWQEIMHKIPGSIIVKGYPRERYGIIIWGFKKIPKVYEVIREYDS